MYNVDATLLDRFKENIQTEQNNCDPRPLVYITRNRTAINSQKFWERQLITSTVGTRSSIAVRRPEGSFFGDMIFTAQVESGTAVIRYAVPRDDINDMTWTTLTTIPTVTELSILFDGYMVMHDNVVEQYTTGDYPWVFYVNTSGELNGLNLDDPEATEISISDNAVNIASVRGLYSETANLDDGIWVFYNNTDGELWEARILDGEVEELNEITIKPTGVTEWSDLWAGFSFDYRIMLQLKGDDGKVYSLMSKSRPGGFSNIEHLRIRKATMTGTIGLPPPIPLVAENVEV